MIRNKLFKGGRDFDTTRNMRYTCSIFEATYLKVLLVIVLQMCTCSQRYEEVDCCPMNQTEWSRRAAAKNCRSVDLNYRYLCASIQDNPCHFGEICTRDSYITKGECAVINGHTHNMDSTYCHAASGCPDEKYEFSNLYLYPMCFQDFYSETTAPCPSTQSTTTQSTVSGADTDGSLDAGLVIGVLVTLIVVVVIIMLSILYRQKKLPDWMRNSVQWCIGGENRNGSNRSTIASNEEEGREKDRLIPVEPGPEEQKIRKLQRYFVQILKSELKVADLHENIILCSSSLKEHFNESLLKDLHNVESEDDYDNLDMTLVFAFLINFCTKIKPPLKGWGYDPPNDEISVGADIERIRSMWNKYCDNDHDYPQLQDVYSRMIQRYGGIPQRIINEEVVRTKYQAECMKRDCEISNGTVITQNIKYAMKLLENSNVVPCKGAIGCGKTTAMRYIENKFEEKGWKTIWKEEYLKEEDLVEDEIKETLICCDNLFGTFNFNECSYVSSVGIESTLQNKIERIGGKSKVLLGIHQHVFDTAMKQKVNEVQFLQGKHFVIDMDEHTKAELLLIWKELKTEGHCVRDKKSVDFPSVLSKLSLNQGLVGKPVILFMYCLCHSFFSDGEFTKSPLTTLANHFKRMESEEKDRDLFLVLVYIICLRVYKKEEYNDALAGDLDAFLSETKIKECIKNYPEYFNDEDETVEVKHELLSISLFKASFEIERIRNTLATHCDIGTILQLTRTKEDCDSDFVSCLPPSDTENKDMLYLLKRIAEAKSTRLKRSDRACRKIKTWKRKLQNKW